MIVRWFYCLSPLFIHFACLVLFLCSMPSKTWPWTDCFLSPESSHSVLSQCPLSPSYHLKFISGSCNYKHSNCCLSICPFLTTTYFKRMRFSQLSNVFRAVPAFVWGSEKRESFSPLHLYPPTPYPPHPPRHWPIWMPFYVWTTNQKTLAFQALAKLLVGIGVWGGWGGQESPLIRENTQDLSSGKGIGAWGRPAYCQFYLLLCESRERKLKPSKVIEHLKFISVEKIIAVLTRKNMATHLILQLSHRDRKSVV